MRTAPVANVKAKLNSYLDACVKGPVVVTRNGRPAAVLINAPENSEDLERLVLAHTPAFIEVLAASEESARMHGAIKQEDFWRMIKERKIGSASPKATPRPSKRRAKAATALDKPERKRTRKRAA